MKHVLITGENSYIGRSLETWLMREPDNYTVDSIKVKGDAWKEKDFSKYDVIFHVAGIAHIKETKENEALYYKVNRDLAYEIAKRAKFDGVKQFIFLSSMSVYGLESGVIDKRTSLKPANAYGKSKLEAEKLINTLVNDMFSIATLRPPMVYGKGCKGNYPKLAKLVLKVPIFPKINNNRSMIYIDNLSEFVKLLIDDCNHGLFFPQNVEYVSTSEMVRLIAKAHGKEIWMPKLFNPLLRLLNTNTVHKLFNNLVYEQNISEYKKDYRIYDLEESIIMTELRD